MGGTAGAGQMRDHSNIREVMSDADFERWYALYDDIFFDPADLL